MGVQEKLEKFVRRITLVNSGYTRIQLVQLMASSGESLLCNHELTAQYGYDAGKISEMTAELLSLAQEDADGHLGVTAYCLRGCKGITAVERGPIFRLRSQDSSANPENSILGETEPATPTGLQAQLMRHLEAVNRSSAQKDEIYANALLSTIKSQQERLTHYEDRHWDNVMKAEELASEKEDREIRKLNAISRDKRFDEALKTFKPLVPIAISKLRGLSPDAKANTQLEALRAIMKNVEPDKMEQIMVILGKDGLSLATMYLDAHKEQIDNEQSGEIPQH
jgi:hypothetical protein